jgi:hypothetical protein
MLGPKIERLALLGRVGGAVVDSGDASLVAADMIEHRFDNMRQYSKFDNPGGDRAADVMQSPGLQFEFLESVERLIKALEAGKTLFEMIGPDNKDEAVN